MKIGFTVRASESVGGSVADLTKKNKGSISSLHKVAGNIGGSLLSLGGKEKKNFKKIAASVTKKVEKVGGKAKKSVSSLKLVSRVMRINDIFLPFLIEQGQSWACLLA